MATPCIRGILFDLGDTLLDFGAVDTIDLFEQGAHLTYAYLQENGYKLPTFSAYHRYLLRVIRRSYLWSQIIRREFNALDVIAKHLRKMNLQASDEQIAHIAWLWYQPLSTQADIEPGTAEMLKNFTDQGVTLGVISNTFIPGPALDKHLDQAGLLEYLPHRIYSCDVRYRKPDRRIFEIALARTGLQAGETMFVGDTPKADICGAKRAGMVAVLKDPNDKFAGHRCRPDHTIRSLTELPALVAQYA